MQALRELEIAAERIHLEPQIGPVVLDALRSLRGPVERWRLLYLREYLQFDAAAEPHRLIGAHQNASAALREIAHDLKRELLNPIELPALVRDRGNDSH